MNIKIFSTPLQKEKSDILDRTKRNDKSSSVPSISHWRYYNTFIKQKRKFKNYDNDSKDPKGFSLSKSIKSLTYKLDLEKGAFLYNTTIRLDGNKSFCKKWEDNDYHLYTILKSKLLDKSRIKILKQSMRKLVEYTYSKIGDELKKSHHF